MRISNKCLVSLAFLASTAAACADAELEGALYGAAVYVWRDRETLAALVAALVGGEERA
jgi:hypothetical protein